MPRTIRPFSVPALLAAALAVAVLAPRAEAQQTIKVGVIDTEKVLLESAAGKQVLADLRTLQEQKVKEGEALQQEIEGLRKRLSDGELSLSEPKKDELRGQIEEKTISLRRFQDDANRELNKKKDELLAQVDRQVMPVITRVGQEMGYSLIFRKFESGLIFASEDADVTDEVIQRLNAPPAAAPAGTGGAGG
jgi:outer membrane protein